MIFNHCQQLDFPVVAGVISDYPASCFLVRTLFVQRVKFRRINLLLFFVFFSLSPFLFSCRFLSRIFFLSCRPSFRVFLLLSFVLSQCQLLCRGFLVFIVRSLFASRFCPGIFRLQLLGRIVLLIGDPRGSLHVVCTLDFAGTSRDHLGHLVRIACSPS